MDTLRILMKLIYFLITSSQYMDCYNFSTNPDKHTIFNHENYDSQTVQLLQSITSKYFRTDTQFNVIVSSETTDEVTSYLRMTHMVLSVPLLIFHVEKGGKKLEYPANSNKQLGIGSGHILFIENLTSIEKEITEMQQFVTWNNKGRFLIVPLKEVQEPEISYDYFSIFWQYKILNVEVLSRRSCQGKHTKLWCFRFLTYNPFTNSTITKQNISTNDIINRDARNHDILFPDKTRNVGKYPLFISDISVKGLVTIIRNNDGTFNKTSDILESIIRHMNFTPVLVKEKYAKRLVNTKLPNGTWVGPIEEVASSYADICSFTFNFLIERWEAVDFCTPFILTAFTFISPTARRVPQWRCFFHPYTKLVWALMASLFVYIFVCERFIQFIIAKNSKTPSIIDSILYVLSIGLQIGVPEPTSRPRKTLLILSVLAFLVLSSLYQSSLVSFMIHPRYYPVINSIDDVADSDLVIEMLPQNIKILESSPQARFKKILSNSQVTKNFVEAVGAIANKGDRLAFNSLFGAEAMEQLYRSSNGKSKINLVKETIGLIFRSYIVPKNSPYIHNFNHVIDAMVEAGLRDRHSVKDENATGRNQDNNKDNDDSDLKVLTLYHFQAVFFLFVLGTGSSIITFVTELAYSYRQKV